MILPNIVVFMYVALHNFHFLFLFCGVVNTVLDADWTEIWPQQ